MLTTEKYNPVKVLSDFESYLSYYEETRPEVFFNITYSRGSRYMNDLYRSKSLYLLNLLYYYDNEEFLFEPRDFKVNKNGPTYTPYSVINDAHLELTGTFNYSELCEYYDFILTKFHDFTPDELTDFTHSKKYGFLWSEYEKTNEGVYPNYSIESFKSVLKSDLFPEINKMTSKFEILSLVNPKKYSIEEKK